MVDLKDRFEAYVFVPKRERIVQKWRVIQCQFVTLFSGNGITRMTEAPLRSGVIAHFIHVRPQLKAHTGKIGDYSGNPHLFG